MTFQNMPDIKQSKFKAVINNSAHFIMQRKMLLLQWHFGHKVVPPLLFAFRIWFASCCTAVVSDHKTSERFASALLSPASMQRTPWKERVSIPGKWLQQQYNCRRIHKELLLRRDKTQKKIKNWFIVVAVKAPPWLCDFSYAAQPVPINKSCLDAVA